MTGELPKSSEYAMTSKEFDIAGYIHEFFTNEHFIRTMANYPELSLGAENILRVKAYSEEALALIPRIRTAEATAHELPVLPFLRTYQDLDDEKLVIVIKGARNHQILTVPPENIEVVSWSDSLGDRDRLRLRSDDLYVNIDTEYDNPSVMRARDLELLKDFHPGSGHGSLAGAYFRFALLDAVLRPTSPEHRQVLVGNILSFARCCQIVPNDYARALLKQYAQS